jgi:hypothetical protein
MKNRGLIATLVLLILFGACDKNNELSGLEMLVQIRSLEMAEGVEEDVMRSASWKEIEPVATSVGDGLLLELSMEQDASPLRVLQPLVSGAHFRVIAVKAGTNEYVSHGNFTIGGATVDNNFLVTSYSSYDFICISYNNTVNTLPAFNPAKGTDLSAAAYDLGDVEHLLWWKSASSIPVTTAGPALSITLNYVEAKVKVIVDCSYNGWEITGIGNGVTLGSVTTGETTHLMSGVVSGTTGNRPITWPAMNIITPTQQTSNPLSVMAKGNGTLTVTFSKNVITRKNLQPIPTTEGTYALKGNFNTALAAGKSYTLRVKLRSPKFAGSNIYWNGSQLTFDLHGNTANQYYQGVHFRYGSLIGVSAAKGSFINNSTPVYKPGVGQTIWASWETVPYTVGAIGADNITAGTGDICRYLGTLYPSALAGYRLPNISEFGGAVGEETWHNLNPTTMPVHGGWVKGINPWTGTNHDAGSVDGKSNLSSYGYAKNLTMNELCFPTSGYRWYEADTNSTDAVASAGFYWSNSTHVFDFDGSRTMTRIMPSTFGFSVRCVKND